MAETEELARKITTAIAERDFRTIDEYIDPNAEVYYRGETFSAQTIFEGMREGQRKFNLLDIRFHEIITADSKTATYWTGEYELVSEYMGTEASSKTYYSPAAMFFEFEDDTVVKLYTVSNREGLLSHLGILTDTVTGGSLGSDLAADQVRVQYHDVLSRVFRHNIRNKADVILAIAEKLLAEDTTAQTGRQLRQTTEELVSLAMKVRKVEQEILERSLTPRQVVVREVCESVIEDQGWCSSARWSIEEQTAGDLTLQTDRVLVVSILQELLENAITHTASQPHVRIGIDSASGEEFAVEITVTDDGPGIPEHELAPLESQSETGLNHASSIGLWRVKWCVDRLDGELAFETVDGGGSRVRVRLPELRLTGPWMDAAANEE